MKRIARLTALCLMLSACGGQRTINGTTYDVFGLVDMQDKRNDAIEYEISLSSVIVAVMFSETVVIPLYVICFDLWQPVGPLPTIKGAVPTP